MTLIQVERLLRVETQLLRIPKNLVVGPIILDTSPIKNALHGFSMAWKARYADVLHEEAKVKMMEKLDFCYFVFQFEVFYQ